MNFANLTAAVALTAAVDQRLERSPLERRWFDPRPRHTKVVIKIVPDASLLSAHIRIGLASLSPLKPGSKYEMNSIRSWDNLFCNRLK